MTAKTTEFGTPAPVHNAANGAAQVSANPSKGSAAQFDRFIAAFADGETHKAAAKLAGITLSDVAARREADETFDAAYRLARKTRLMVLADALWAEAIGTEQRDPVNGVVRVVRDRGVLQRLAVHEGELTPEKPAVAIQNNVGAPTDPKLIAAIEHNRRTLIALLRSPKPAALPSPAVIDVQAERIAETAMKLDAVLTPRDADEDLL
jgi:hypothetical protein